MKILKIWSSFQTELKYHDHYLSEIMQKDGVKTTFVSSDKIDLEFLPFLENKNIEAGLDDYKGSKIIRLKSIEFMRKPFIIEIKKLYLILTNKKYNLVHIYGIGNPISMLSLLILKVFRKDMPVIINDHSNINLKNTSIIGSIYYKINIFLFSKLQQQVNLIITPNISTNNFVKKHYSIDSTKMKIIPLGYDKQIFSYNKNLKNKSNKLIIGFAGKILQNKRLELLIDVVSELDNNSIECEFIGMNENETQYQIELKNYAKEKGIQVIFKALFKEETKLAKFYNYIDLAVFPGSISITTLEANGCGTPIVLYNSIEGLENRVEGDRGFLFDKKEELTKYILKYINMKKEKNIINHIIEEQSKKYSWQELSKEYLKIYKYILIKKAKGKR